MQPRQPQKNSTLAIRRTLAPVPRRNNSYSTISILLENALPVLLVLLVAALVHRLLSTRFQPPVTAFPDFDLLTPHDLNSDLLGSDLLLNLTREEAASFTTQVGDFIYFDFDSPYGVEDQSKDKEFVTELVLHIYKYNYVDRCKLASLFNIFPSSHQFTFMLTPLEFGGAAKYLPRGNMILIPARVHLTDPVTAAQYISHELAHALDAYNNMRNGVCIEDQEGVVNGNLFIYGANKNASCGDDENDRRRVTKLIKRDVARIEKMYLLLTDSSKKISDVQQAELNTLFDLIKKYDYKITLSATGLGGPGKEENIKSFQESYQLDKTGTTYRASTGWMGLTQQIVPLVRRHNSTSYFLSYNFNTNQIISSHTRLDNVSPRTLAQDLLINLMYLVDEVKRDVRFSKNAYTHEVSAFFDQVLAPYSHKISGSQKTLKEWLLPELSAHQFNRAAKEVQACLVGNYRKR